MDNKDSFLPDTTQTQGIPSNIPPVQTIPPIQQNLINRMFSEKPIVPVIAGACIVLIILGSTIIGIAYGIRSAVNETKLDIQKLTCDIMCFVTTAIYVLSFVLMIIKWKTVRNLFCLSGLFTWSMVLGAILLIPLIAVNFGLSHLFDIIGLRGTDWNAIFSNDWFAIFTFICIVPAISEEILFRGIMQTSLAEITTPVKAILMTSLLFAIIHLNPLHMPYIFALSILLCWVRWKSRSILPVIILHCIHNYVVVLGF